MDQVSVIIPAYNAAAYLGEALESVLAQEAPPAEIIVVNDGSEDATEQVALRFAAHGVRCVTQENLGASAAVNHGIRLTTSPILAFLDADDLWLREKQRLQLDVLRDRSVDMVFGHLLCFASPEMEDEVLAKRVVPRGPQPGLVRSTLLIRREAFERVGGLNPGVRMGEFIEWYMRAKELPLRSVLLPQVILHRRIHATNQGIAEVHRRPEFVHFLKAALDRRRKQEP